MRKTTIAARRNPEQNRKVPAWEYLSKWREDPDVYISFTTIDKIGVNPDSQYSTPLGIYTYPLQTAWWEYGIGTNKSLSEIPFAGTEPHIWVLRLKDKPHFVEDLYTKYGSNKFDKDVKTLKKIFYTYYSEQLEKQILRCEIKSQESEQNYRDRMNTALAQVWDVLYREALDTARTHNSACSFWNLSRLIAVKMANGSKNRSNTLTSSVKWNWILRKCGYSGFADKSGKGIIHPSEPMQAVFLTKDAFTVVGETYNKEYKGQGDKRRKIYEMFDFNRVVRALMEHLEGVDLEWDKTLFSWLVGSKWKTSVKSIKKLVLKATPEELWQSCEEQDFAKLTSYCLSQSDDSRWWRTEILPLVKALYYDAQASGGGTSDE
jgi:hypothetical protein